LAFYRSSTYHTKNTFDYKKMAKVIESIFLYLRKGHRGFIWKIF
jgi:hypothetical protein